MSIILLDNYDSFTFNLFQLIAELAEKPLVVRNDTLSIDEIVQINPSHVVISPGPGHPDTPGYFGIGRSVIESLGANVPILGVCLGHQGIAVTFGARVVRAPAPMHGKVSRIRHDGSVLYADIPEWFDAMRYHSLVVERSTLPADLVVNAETDDGIVMAIAHRSWPVHGVQFHPESIGTREGRTLLRNFLAL
jgi:anthranilate synthase/aminodeoxychorismate synthase-like glutamine amidotransferase